MQEALYDMALFREFAGLAGEDNLPDESTILRFCHLLEAHRRPVRLRPCRTALWCCASSHPATRTCPGVSTLSGADR
jgi:hypothetical protein